VAWVRRYVRFNGLRHPRDCDADDVRRFLEHLANERSVAASTQNQAFAALQFLYRDVLGTPLGSSPRALRAKSQARAPNVLNPEEVDRVLHELTGMVRLVCQLLYGSGMRLSECLSLRVKDVDVSRAELIIRSGKGDKDRRTVLPDRLREPMREALEASRTLHLRDVGRGGGYVALPNALDRKYPRLARDWRWMWLFPAQREYVDRVTKRRMRYHLFPTTVQRQLARAVEKSGVHKRVTAHTFRHSFATHLLRSGYDIRTVQELLGHRDVSTTMVYLHVLDRGVGVRSPLDALPSPVRPL
jgi:integron integrase